MSITISVAVLVLIAFSVLLFVAVTAFCGWSGLFDYDACGIGALFTVLFYAIGWLAPSLIAVSVWAIWFRS